MSAYYIINQSGILKQYYSVKNSTSIELTVDPIIFSVSLRNAKTFLTYEEAYGLITSKKMIDCHIIDQNGNIQNK